MRRKLIKIFMSIFGTRKKLNDEEFKKKREEMVEKLLKRKETGISGKQVLLSK